MANPLRAMSWVMGVAGKQKSFRANPILANTRLNEWGLHRRRVAMAERMARFRRSWMASALSAEDRAAYARDGFLVKPDYLPEATLTALRDEVFGAPLPAREMRQGQTVTRMAALSGAPVARGVSLNRDLRNMMSYVGGRGGEPVFCIQTVIADPARSETDPQTEMHADTFHSTSKCWLFLTDVGEDDGPFVFVPGSHRLTPERLDWEYRQSLTAAADARPHHSFGSFRVRPDELEALGYGPPRRMAVPANTLIVADTYGFHHRAPSDRPTLRVELYGYLRRNPFVPWNGLDAMALPGIRGRQIDLFFRQLDAERRFFGKTGIWHDVGRVTADSAATI